MRTRWLKNLSVIRPSWFCILISRDATPPGADKALRELGYLSIPGPKPFYALKTQQSWHLEWRKVEEVIQKFALHPVCHIAIVPGEECPTLVEAELQQSELSDVAESCEQMWLLEAIENGQVMCRFVPVMDKRGEIFGYESLVRVQRPDGSLANGGDIFRASRILRIEHLIDRHLHEVAVRQFAEAKLGGFLFINVLPGFIQRPEVYLSGIKDACGQTGLPRNRIVLDCTNSENPRDVLHLKAIFTYCRHESFLFSLDDIESLTSVNRIFNELRPDFIKLDMQLVHKIPAQEAMETIHNLVDFTRASACTVIAEGVESKEVEDLLSRAGVTLFQGYLYGENDRTGTPAALSAAEKQSIRRKPA